MDVRRGRAAAVAGRSADMRVSVVVPVLNEEMAIGSALDALQPWRSLGHEVLVVDGGSSDATLERAEGRADRVIRTERGRARQMNAGAAAAQGDLLVFLHADTRLPGSALSDLEAVYSAGRPVWGRFDVQLSGSHFLFRIIETAMNWRSRLTGIATGDQAIFVDRILFGQAGGYGPLPLMEDIDLSRRLRRRVRPRCLRSRVVTDSRRWEVNGILGTVGLMWLLRLRFWLGADPTHLAGRYYPSQRTFVASRPAKSCSPEQSHAPKT